MPTESGFRLELVRSETVTKLRSVCLKCGEERIVSVLNGSLQEWHKTHRCASAPAAPRKVIPLGKTQRSA